MSNQSNIKTKSNEVMKNIKNKAIALTVTGSALVATTPALAAFADGTEHLKKQGNAGVDLFVWFCGAAGLVLIGLGVFMAWSLINNKASQRVQEAGFLGAFGSLAAGAILMVITVFAAGTAGTFSAGSEADAEKQINELLK